MGSEITFETLSDRYGEAIAQHLMMEIEKVERFVADDHDDDADLQRFAA